MTIEQVIAMISRRGYEVFRYPLPDDADNLRKSMEIIAIRFNDLEIRWAIPLLDLTDLASTAIWRDLVERRLVPFSNGDHYMQCRICLTPVLRGHETRAFAKSQLRESIAKYGDVLLVKEWTPVGPREQRWVIQREDPKLFIATCYRRFVYRLASSGPDSEPITHCPRCHVPIEECVREIEDRDAL